MAITGRSVIESLAQRFPQLYVAPSEDALEAHRAAMLRGIAPEGANLDHFTSTPEDELRVVETPAGPVEVIFLKDRHDFETFLQIIGHKSSTEPIARTVGAITYRGLPDWEKIRAAQAEYLAAGGDDWGAELNRLVKVPGAIRIEIVVISEGPYSNIPASDTPYNEEDWVPVSREIRLHHECAHVVCRRTIPEDILPIWDEITADVVGLICATGRYDAALAMRFLGINEEGYYGGRLAEYLDDEQKERIDEVAREVATACKQIEAAASEEELAQPFDYLLRLKAEPLVKY